MARLRRSTHDAKCENFNITLLKLGLWTDKEYDYSGNFLWPNTRKQQELEHGWWERSHKANKRRYRDVAKQKQRIR